MLSARSRSGILAAAMQSLDAATLARHYRESELQPAEVMEDVLARIARRGDDGVWIALTPRERLLDDARALARRRAAGEPMPL
jgi:Asp-tRNA(Asn)/Glu-tRNA(Gln) amidotransferase A subunit family amidase